MSDKKPPGLFAFDEAAAASSSVLLDWELPSITGQQQHYYLSTFIPNEDHLTKVKGYLQLQLVSGKETLGRNERQDGE